MPNLAQRQRGWGRRKPPPGTPVDGGHPLSQGLGGAWLFNEGGGKLVNDVLGKNPGTITGTFSGWTTGALGLAPAMVGGSGKAYVQMASLMTAAIVNVSYACWFMPLATSQLAYVFCNGDTGTSTDSVILQNNGSGAAGSKLTLLLDGVGFDVTTSTATLAAGVPCFAVATATAANLWTLYVNGVKNTSATATAHVPTVGSGVGAADRGFSPMNGQVALAAWWSRCLSAAEVLWLYQEPYGFMAQWAPRRAFFGPVAPTAGVPWDVPHSPWFQPVLAQ